MTETKDPEENATKAGRKTITLKRTVESGMVRQNFSHGRSKSVVVEKKRSKRSPMNMQEAAAAADSQERKAAASEAKPRVAQQGRGRRPEGSQQTGGDRQRNVLRQLSSSEVDARARALVESRKREEIERQEQAVLDKHRAEEEKQRAEEEAVRKAEEARLTGQIQDHEAHRGRRLCERL
jgi:translation initiation factor IF-2